MTFEELKQSYTDDDCISSEEAFEEYKSELFAVIEKGAKLIREHSILLMITVFGDGVNFSLDTHTVASEEEFYKQCDYIITRGEKFIISLVDIHNQQVLNHEVNKYQI